MNGACGLPRCCSTRRDKKNMKPLIFLAITCVAFISSAVAQTSKPSPAIADAAAAKEIHNWLEHWAKAFSTKDADAVAALYTDDVVAYDLVPPLQYIGKAAYRGDYQQLF
jgi:hypothetical protein